MPPSGVNELLCHARVCERVSRNEVVLDKPPLNRWAVAGLLLSVAVAVVALFLLPWLRSQGVSFGVGFWSIAAVEFVAAISAAYFVFNLRDDGDVERY